MPSDEYHVPGFQSFSGFSHQFVLGTLATSSIRVNYLVTLNGLKVPQEIVMWIYDTSDNT